MGEKIKNLSQILVTPEREFPPRTPHTYSHLGAVATVIELYPDLPELARVYDFPAHPENGV